MDRAELNSKLGPFFSLCKEKGFTIEKHCLEEAFPGIDSTSYFLKVYAPWIEDRTCSDVLTILFDILWESTDEEVRRNIFAIKVFNKSEELHCYEECDFEKFNK